MPSSPYIFGIVLLATILPTLPIHAEPKEMSLPELEALRAEIDEELNQLAKFSLRGEVGSNGYRSPRTMDANRNEWIEVDLGREISIDEIVLVPALSRSTAGIQSEGFPITFRILAGSTDGKEGSVIASFTKEDQLLPRVAPLVVPCHGTVASWVRIEATQLSSRSYDGFYALQLSELLIFSGAKNYALQRPVSGPHPDPYPINPWKLQYLTDGSVPYLMNAATGQKSRAYIRSSNVGENVGEATSLTIDLQGVHEVSVLNLYAVDQSDTIPQSTSGDVGIPRHLQVEGATRADFSDAVLLLDARFTTLYDISPIMTWNIVPPTPCRYVRLTAHEPYVEDNGLLRRARIGFAEIELFAEGRNVAQGKPVSGNFKHPTKDSPLAALTDGRNFYGNILPIREWMHQLARRHDLEKKRPIIAAELQRRYTRQEVNLRRMSWLAALLAGGILLTILIDRMIRMQHVAEIRARFAADLHDELGADIHTIGLLSDLAMEARNRPEKLSSLLTQIRSTTEETGTAVRHCSNMQEAHQLGTVLPDELRRAAQRIVVDLEHEFSVEGAEFINQLKLRSQSDLLLFYKECLVNITRHSGATRIKTRLVASSREVRLTISDNGVGVDAVPASLKRRARLLRAKITAEPSASGGSKIILTLRPRLKWLP